jgi:IS30 family transposase
LLRQYFPKGTSLRPYSQAGLNEVAAKLNIRPPETLRLANSGTEVRRAVALTLTPPGIPSRGNGSRYAGHLC